MRVEWGGQAIDVREAGVGSGLVLVHGYPLDGAMWSGVARTLATRFRVLKPDLPGRGENPVGRLGRHRGYADFLEALVKTLAAPVGLAGFSMGGYVTLALLRRRPESVRALALVDTRAEADDEEGKKKRDEAIATVRSEGVAKIADGMVPRLLSEAALANRDLVERVRRVILRQKPETVASDLSAMRGRRDATDLLAGLAPSRARPRRREGRAHSARALREDGGGDPRREARHDSRRGAPRRRWSGPAPSPRRSASSSPARSSDARRRLSLEADPHPQPHRRRRRPEDRLPVVRVDGRRRGVVRLLEAPALVEEDRPLGVEDVEDVQRGS